MLDIFTTALGLTRQENSFALTGFLVDKLGTVFHPKNTAVYEVFGIPGNYTKDHAVDLQSITIRRFNYDHNQERKSTDSSHLIDAVKSGHPIVIPAEDVEHIAIPVHSKHGPLRLIVISDIVETPEERLSLFQMVDLYSSLIALHDSHERDQLTNLLNRQTFNHFYERTARSSGKQKIHMFLAIFDIDHFKRVNDTYGHLFGDEVLLQFAQLMERNFRYNDALFRFGGEEFICLVTCENMECAEISLNRFRKSVENHDFPGVGKVTVSAGYVRCSANDFPTTVIGLADSALYHAKAHGRNQVINYEDIKQDTAEQEGEIDLF